MLLEGVVTNVAAFGAFVDVGVHQDGLVHVSALSDSYVSDPHDVVKSGDIVRVKVLDVDLPRKRISLTLRLNDEARAPRGERGERGEQSGGGERRGGGGERRGNPPRQGGRGGQGGQGSPGGQGAQGGQGGRRGGSAQPAPGGGAMADALRRAGLTGGGK
jgi:uncharacterized protein